MKNVKTDAAAVGFPVAAESVHICREPVDDFCAFFWDMQMLTISLHASFMPQYLPFGKREQDHSPQGCCDSKMREQNIVTPYNPGSVELIIFHESLAAKGASP